MAFGTKILFTILMMPVNLVSSKLFVSRINSSIVYIFKCAHMWVVGTYVKLSKRISIHLIGTGNEEVNQGVKIVDDVLVDTLYMDRYEECQRECEIR